MQRFTQILFSLTIYMCAGNAQIDTTQYHDLAKYCIIRNALTGQNMAVPSSRVFLNGSIEDVGNLLHADSINYEIKFLGQFRDIKIIAVIDLTNFKIHSPYSDVILIKTVNSENIPEAFFRYMKTI